MKNFPNQPNSFAAMGQLNEQKGRALQTIPTIQFDVAY